MKGGSAQRYRLCVSSFRLVCELNLAVVIAMTVMRMVKVSVNHVIHVIAVWNRLMAAVLTVLVIGAVRSAVVAFGAVDRIRGADLKLVLVDMAFVKRVQVTVVKVIGMTVVEDRCMTAARAMLMSMVLMNFMLN
jgi:hypothetical protein